MSLFPAISSKAYLAVAALVLLVGVGCNGPSRAGEAARVQARARMEKATSVIVFDQARQSYESGEFDRALHQVDEAIYRTPNEARFWVLRGRINLEKSRLEQALKDFDQAIAVKPEHAEAWYCKGIVHERWARTEEAVAAYSKAAELDTTKVSYLLAGAEVLVGVKRFDEAEAILTPRLDYFENNAPMHQLLGQIAMLRDKPVIAAEHYKRAMLIDPKLPMVLDNLVRAEFAARQFDDCLTDVRRLEREAEGGRTPERVRIEGRCLAMLGRPSDARNVFAELTRDNPEDAQGWVDLASVAWETGEGERVQLCASRLLRIAPHRYEGYFFQGLIEDDRGNHEAAATWYRKAAEAAKAAGDEVPESLREYAVVTDAAKS